MRLLSRGERGVIEEIRRHFRGLTPQAPEGIGDDAAVLRAPSAPLIVSTDALVESVDFRRHEPAFLLGRRALAVNLSDLAAMGASPHGFLLTLAVPDDLTDRFVGDLLDGMASRARAHRVRLLGGDLSRSPGPLAISITILGISGGKGAPLTRKGARPGDGIWLSGPLGASAAGRMFLESGWKARLAGRKLIGATPPKRGRADRIVRLRASQAIARHLDPSPRLALGLALRRGGIASAAIDVSDGLSSDLAHLAEASGVGARVLSAALPIADSARACARVGVDPVALALHGGEDYELLFTVPRRKERLAAKMDAVLIGRIARRSAGLRLIDPAGREKPLTRRGFDHFLPRARGWKTWS